MYFPIRTLYKPSNEDFSHENIQLKKLLQDLSDENTMNGLSVLEMCNKINVCFIFTYFNE